MAYQTYSLLLTDNGVSFRLDVPAVSLVAAMADVVAAYGDVALLQYSVR